MLLKLSTYKTPLRYFFAVIVGYSLEFATYSALVSFEVSVYLANAAGFCIGVIINVVLIRKFVFQDSRFRLQTDLQLSFASHGLMFGLGMGLLWLLVEFKEMNPYLAKLVTNGTTFTLNYVLRAVFFRKK